jgi:hypothetical protein
MKFPAIRQIFSRAGEPRTRQSAPQGPANTPSTPPVQEAALQAAPRRARDASAGSRPRVAILGRLFKRHRHAEPPVMSRRESPPPVAEPVVPGPSRPGPSAGTPTQETRDEESDADTVAAGRIDPYMPAFAHLPIERWRTVARELPDGSFAALGQVNHAIRNLLELDAARRRGPEQALSTDGIRTVDELLQLLQQMPRGTEEEIDLLLIAGSRLWRIRDPVERQAARHALLAAIEARGGGAGPLPAGLRFLRANLVRDSDPARRASALDSLNENLERNRHLSADRRARFYLAVVRDLGTLDEEEREDAARTLRGLQHLHPEAGPAFDDLPLLVGRIAVEALANGARAESVRQFYRTPIG